jgi:flagellar hook-associated protein 3 FlgL
MRITNNMVTNNLLSQIQQLNAQQATLQGEVGSGLRISQPSDDPSAVGQVLNLESQNTQITQYGNNASRALSVSQASYSGLNSLMQVFNRASELAAEGGNGVDATNGPTLATEMDQLVQQATQVANSQLGSEYLYSGTAVTTAPFTTSLNSQGQIASVTYSGNSNQAAIPLSGTTSISPWTPGATNTGIRDFINTLANLRDALASGNTTALATATTSLNTSEDTLTSAVAETGAVQSRILSDQTQQQAGLTEIASQISSLADADLPTTIVHLNQVQLAYQAALQTAGQVMQLSILNYIH